jgi:hypothetical protein
MNQVLVCLGLTVVVYVTVVAILRLYSSCRDEWLPPVVGKASKLIVAMLENNNHFRGHGTGGGVCSLPTYLQGLRANLQYHGALQGDEYVLVTRDQARASSRVQKRTLNPNLPIGNLEFGEQLFLLLNRMDTGDTALVFFSSTRVQGDVSPFVLGLQLSDASLVGVVQPPKHPNGGASWRFDDKNTGSTTRNATRFPVFSSKCFLMKKTPWIQQLVASFFDEPCQAPDGGQPHQNAYKTNLGGSIAHAGNQGNYFATNYCTEDLMLTDAISKVAAVSVDEVIGKPRTGFKRYLPDCRHVLVAKPTRPICQGLQGPNFWDACALYLRRLVWATEDNLSFI